MGLAKAVRLAARVLDGERRREQRAHDRGAGDGNTFRDIGLEIATIAVEGGEVGAASAFVYEDADVERVLASLNRGSGEQDGGDEEEGGGD